MVDLSDYSFADWMNFVFNHPVDPVHPWYMADCVLYDFDSAVMLQHLSTLFARPELAYLIYTPEQIDQGLSFIVSERGFIGILLDQDLPLRLRRDCIMQMATLLHLHQERYPALPGTLYWWQSAIRNCRYHYQRLYQNEDIIRYFLRILNRMLNRKTIPQQLRKALENGLQELKRTVENGLIMTQTSRKRTYTKQQMALFREVLDAELDGSGSGSTEQN